MTPANPTRSSIVLRLRGTRRVVVAVACLAAVSPTGVAMAQSGSGVPLGSAKKLSTAPPSSSQGSTTTRTTTSTRSSATTASASTSATSSAVKQLPFTGFDVSELVIAGAALLLAGIALHVRTRHARTR